MANVCDCCLKQVTLALLKAPEPSVAAPVLKKEKSKGKKSVEEPAAAAVVASASVPVAATAASVPVAATPVAAAPAAMNDTAAVRRRSKRNSQETTPASGIATPKDALVPGTPGALGWQSLGFVSKCTRTL